jgi:hypothetical protein
MRYAYALLSPDREPDQFASHVSLMTYGDDNIMSVSEQAPWFNHTTIVRAFASLGIVYTMADKESQSVPYIHISEASFLKRTWVWNEEVGNYLAPLDHDSIEKMLTVWVASKSVEPVYQLRSVITSAVREYFFYGREVYEEKRQLLRKIFVDKGFVDYVEAYMFPTFDELIWEFNNNVVEPDGENH